MAAAIHLIDWVCRFGVSLFHPRCPACSQCQSLRVVVDRFTPDRRMRRARKTNEGDVRLSIGTPSVTRAKLDLYDRFHAFQSDFKGWPGHPPKGAESYVHSFVENPIPTEEWCYYLNDELIGVGYVDALTAGLSAIYFFYAPEMRERSLGTWNVLSLIEQATLVREEEFSRSSQASPRHRANVSPPVSSTSVPPTRARSASSSTWSATAPA